MNRNNIYTVNPLCNGSTTQTTEDGSVQSGGTTIIYQQGGGTGLTDAQKQKLDGIQEGAEVNQNAYSKVRLNGSDALIIEAKNKTDILNMSGVYPIAIAINGNGGLDFTVSSDQSNTNSVVTQSQLKAAIDQLEKDKYWKVDADGKLYTELDVYSHKEISAYGAGTGGGSTGGAGALYECADVLRDGDKVQGAAAGSILSYNGSHWYAIPQSAITPDLTNYATKSYVTQQINDLIGGAPGTLDTLKEIAEALGNNPNFATTVTEMINNIGLRVDQVEDRVVSLEDMFEWDKSASASDPSLWRIKAKKDLYGVGEISAYGYSSGTVPTGAQYMYELKDVLFTELTSGQLLQWNGTKWINIDKNAVGLNETELAKYLTNNNYAKKSDITWANLLNKPTTWGWASITGKPTTLAGYGITDGVPNTRRVSAGSGLAGGGVLSSDVTISLGTIGTAGTYTKITTDMYGRVVSGTTLSESDIPTLQISKISGLQSALNSKLNISDFNTWFTIKKDSQGRIVSIQANYDFFSVGEISAYGYSSGTVPTGAQYMYELKDVLFTELTSGQLLQWNGTKWINIDKNAVGLNETELAKYLTNNNYAKKSDITWANLLNKPTTWGWASITGKPTTLAGYGITDGVPNTRRVSAGSGLAGGGVLSSDVTISLGTIGTAGTYTKITTDMYGRVVSGTTLSESDIPTLQISKISGLQSALNSKLNISDFNTWFTIKKDSQGRIVSIQANYDFFSVGEISAYGLGETQPSVTTLAGLDDVTITSPANGQTLIYDSATSQWKNGTIIGGGNISLNGTVYKPVNGVITLPVASNNKVFNEGITYTKSDGITEIGNRLDFHDPATTNQDYDYRLYQIYDNGAVLIGSGKFRATGFQIPSGTSSQFLKADGSVDSNVYLTQASTDSRYVRKTGDTMTGNLNVPFISTAVNPDNQGNYFYSSDDNFIRRSTWHAALSHLNQKQLTLDLSSLDPNKWYPCVIGAPAHGGTPLRITLFNGLAGNKPTWGSHQQGFSLLLDYEVTGSGWGTLTAIAKLNWYFGSCGGETAFGGRQQNTMTSTEIIYLRGGGIYYYRTTNGQALVVQPNGYTWSLSSYNYSAPVKTSQDNSPMGKTFDQVCWAPNNLRNTRNLWGQPFNGTSDVSGALSGATTITATGDITTSANIGGRSINAGADLTVAGYTYCNGRLYVDRGRFAITAAPAISLAIGDTDTGFHWYSDGAVHIYSNGVAVGTWTGSEFRYGHGYFKQASGNDFHTLGIMVNGNGTANTIKPGIGFHQPGVYANSLRSDGPGDFRFCVQGGTVGCTVQAANFYANGGFLYSSANGCELKIGSQNSSYVHFTTNPARTLYFANSLHISGDVVPYTNEGHALGNSGHWWGGIYGKEVYVSSWVRFTGASGVYWTAYSGGWTMNDATYIRSYGGKSLWIEGSIIANGEVTAYSDIRLKSNIKPLDYKGRLAPKWFIKDNKPSIGFIAQEVQTLYPELVKVNTSTTENYLSLNYGAITAVLSAQVNRVEDEVEALKNRIRQLENEVALLKQKP